MNTLNDVWLFITAWYNLPFTLALLAFLGLSFLQLIGFDQDPEADVDLDYDADVDVDMEADIETDVDDLLGWAGLNYYSSWVWDGFQSPWFCYCF